jgi:pimeloyl-ACP methyl ester carboxylesterase
VKNLIILPGALGGSDQFYKLKENLENDFRVFLFDYSGHHKKKFRHDFSIENFSVELQEFIEHNQIKKSIVFGYSMGGYVALRLICKAPELITGLITLGTKFGWTLENSKAEIKNLNPEIIEQKVPAFAEQLKTRHGENNWKNVLNETSKMMLALGNHNEVLEYPLEKVKVKVWLGRGDKDKMVDRDETIQIINKMPFASGFELPDTKHPFENVNIKIMSAIIQAFAESL